MTSVFLLGLSTRPILGYPLVTFTEIAAKRAGLPIVDELPASGEVIVVDRDAAVTAAALSELAKRPGECLALTDREALVARVDVHVVRDALARGAATLPEVLAGAAIERLELPVARYAEADDLHHAEDVLMRGATKKLLQGDVMGVLNRELTLPMVRPFARANVSPNTVTLVGFLITIAAAVPLAIGGYLWVLLGALLQWVGSLLDGVDGKLARLKGQTSVFGHKLDTRLDMVYYLSLFGALAVGLGRTYGAVPIAAVTAVLLSGMVAAFFVIAGMRRRLVPREHPEQLGPLVYRTIDAHRADPVLGFARATIRVTTRGGLPHIFLVSALLGILPLVFVLAAVTAQLAWMIAMRVETFAARDQRAAAVAVAAAVAPVAATATPQLATADAAAVAEAQIAAAVAATTPTPMMVVSPTPVTAAGSMTGLPLQVGHA
jgi:phosphatidylglycerophosphate synthase